MYIYYFLLFYSKTFFNNFSCFWVFELFICTGRLIRLLFNRVLIIWAFFTKFIIKTLFGRVLNKGLLAGGEHTSTNLLLFLSSGYNVYIFWSYLSRSWYSFFLFLIICIKVGLNTGLFLTCLIIPLIFNNDKYCSEIKICCILIIIYDSNMNICYYLLIIY